MPAKGASTVSAPIRLPTLRALKVRRPNQAPKEPCEAMLTSVLNCWAASGHTSQNCAALEQSLRTCMDLKRAKPQMNNNINHDLSRLYPKIRGPIKKSSG